MQESHRKSLANYPDPESCVGCRKAVREALTGAHAGRVLSCDIKSHRVPTVLSDRKATFDATLGRVAPEPCAVGDPAHVWKLHAREPGAPEDARRTRRVTGRAVKARRRKTAANVPGESDGRVVPTKGPNNGEHVSPAEGLEGRRPTKENTDRQALVPDSEPDMGGVGQLAGVRNVARKDKRVRFTALLHHVTADRMKASFFALKREASPGVDGVTW
jgi:RNA-directed DNA polymerase